MKKILFLLCFFAASAVYAQDTVDTKKIIVIDGKRFKVYNNWLSGGLGIGYNNTIAKMQLPLGVDFNFHIQGQYFQLGTMLIGDQVARNTNNYQLHFGYGRRKESTSMNFAYFAGFSHTTGYELENGLFRRDPYNTWGLYGQAQYIRKLTYDVGIGPALFVDWNPKRTVYGVRVDLFFSGAYKGPNKR